MDLRSENWPKEIPNLVETTGGWVLEGFKPLSPAYNYAAVSNRPAFLYGFHGDGIMKIGRSSNPEQRLKHVRREWKAPHLELVKAERVPYAGSVYAERLMHIQFEEHELRREWFAVTTEEFLDFLPYAVIGAETYDAACREWHANKYPNGEPA